MMTAERIIELFNMRPLEPEGGYYVETSRAGELIGPSALPPRYGRAKALYTSILYLLTPQTQSLLHRLPTDEIFHFYLGDPVDMLQLHPGGVGRPVVLGQDVAAGQQVQLVVPRGVWQGARLKDGGRFALLGTTMAPGFDPTDYEAGRREDLIREYPKYRQEIIRLTI
jgi:predicted cupin superfamily sugar epimerase